MPVYCQYNFHNLSMHRTNYHKHSANVYFRDVNVILSGLMNPQELREFLSDPVLQIEVHDRDRKVGQSPKTAPKSGSDDIKSFNFHGVASLNLSELLCGRRSIKVNLPIKCCPPPPLLDGVRGAWRDEEPVPPGRYTDANSQLKVKVDLAYPLNGNTGSWESQPDGGPFGRIIYLFGYNNSSVMSKLRSEILRISAAAFHLTSCSAETLERALPNYSLNFKLDQSEDLDFVTGFHVLDKRTQIFVVEGLKHKAVRRLWEAVPMK